MAKDKLVELAERCEAATAPSRKMDDEIVQTVLGWERRQLGGVIPWWDKSGDMHAAAPRFTASLDAAMTLVPAGEAHWPQLNYRSVNPNNPKADGHRWSLWTKAGEIKGRGHSCSLALCAAALRSHAQPK